MNKQTTLVFLFLAVTGFIVFYPGLKVGFVADDFIWLEKSRHVSEFNLFDTSSFAFVKGRPGTMLIFSVLDRFFHLYSTGFHCVTLTFHILNAFLLFLIFHTIKLNYGFSLLVSLLFLIHFSNEENIFWAASLCTVFCLFFYLCSVLIYLKWLENSRMIFKISGLIFSVLAVSVREDAVTIPLVFLMLHFWNDKAKEDRPITWVTSFHKNWLFFLPPLFFLIYRWVSLAQDPRGYSFAFSPVIWVQNIAYFLVNLLLPVRYAFDKVGYDVQTEFRNHLMSYQSSVVGVIGISLLILFFLAVRARKKIPNLVKAGLLLFFIGLLPYLFLVGNAPRFLHFSLIGGMIVISSALYAAARLFSMPSPEKFVLLLGAAFTVGNLIVLHERAGWWVRAGQLAENIVAESSVLAGNLEKNEAVYITNLPRRINGVYIFHIGYNEAVSLFHPETDRRLQDIGTKDFDELRSYKDRRIFTYKAGKMQEVRIP
ncbi:MAG: hypothetical protein L0196_11530 [candidate division Zixibacteria bacterium]|nr:hypothetical protein [candidate division Zixibacteria bacterium]